MKPGSQRRHFLLVKLASKIIRHDQPEFERREGGYFMPLSSGDFSCRTDSTEPGLGSAPHHFGILTKIPFQIRPLSEKYNEIR